MQLSATSATSATLKLQSALEVLKAKAQQTQSVRLALVASEVQNALPEGAFTTVLAEIEKMFEKLKGEAASDTKKKNHCKSEYHSITKKSNNYAFLIQKQTAEIETLETLGSSAFVATDSQMVCKKIQLGRKEKQPGSLFLAQSLAQG